MCGRFTATQDRFQLTTSLSCAPPLEWKPRFNIAPSQRILVLRASTEGRREFALPSWGIPPTRLRMGNTHPLINVRAESLQERASLGAAFLRRRCIVIADGFYEWLRRASIKSPAIPVYFKFTRPLGLAGIWEPGDGEGKPGPESCSVITVSANELVSQVHDRMPALLVAENFNRWLDPFAEKHELRELLTVPPASLLRAFESTPAVNNTKNDGPELL